MAKTEPQREQGILAFREKLSAFKEARVTDRIGSEVAHQRRR